MPQNAARRPAVAKRQWPPPSVIILAVAGICRCSGAATGAARFSTASTTIYEPTDNVSLALVRVGGSSGNLTATVTIRASSSATDLISGVDFEVLGTEASWVDGDEDPIIVIVKLFDKAFEPSSLQRKLVLRLEGGVDPSDVGREAEVLISANAGAVRFTFDERALVIADVPPDAPKQCLFRVHRAGNLIGNASFHLEPSACAGLLTKGLDAKALIDYSLSRSDQLVWGDGEDDWKCALYQVARPGNEVDLFVHSSGSQGDKQLLCLQPRAETGLAALFSDSELVLLFNRSAQGTKFDCWRGVPCNLSFDLANSRLQPGGSAYMMDDVHPLNCSAPNGTAKPAVTVPADWLVNEVFSDIVDLFSFTSGKWPIGVCVPHAETPAVLGTMSLYGPYDTNTINCYRGVSTCAIRDLDGFWTDDRDDRKEFVQILSNCEYPETTTDLLVLAGRGFKTGVGFNLTTPGLIKDVQSGEYDLCWCQVSASSNCTLLKDFTVKAGTFNLIGPQTREPDTYTLVESTSSTRLAVDNVGGVELRSSDVASLQRACGEPADEGSFIWKKASGGGSDYEFGPIGNQDLLAGTYRLCWCPTREGIECNDSRDFGADFGEMTVKCPDLLISVGGTCLPCRNMFGEPNDSRTRCEISAERCVVVALSFVFGGVAVWIALLQVELSLRLRRHALQRCAVTTRRIAIEDISPEGSHIFITTTGRHFLRGFGRHIPVSFEGTTHRELDGKAGFRVKATSHRRLELFDVEGRPLAQRVDASMGALYLSLPQTSMHTAFHVPVPTAVLAPALLMLALCIVFFQYDVEANDVGMLLGTYLLIGIVARSRSKPRPNTLSKRLVLYNVKLQNKNPRPEPCDRGAGRAVSAGQLLNLYEFFKLQIRDRTMYYLDPNIVRPLCKQYRLSYAERVGPSDVEWFVSHYWGTEFRVFCESVRRHAVIAAKTEETGTWKCSTYWICTFSNNQYKVEEELGVSHEQSSFYLALHSGKCKGTCMILDEQALPLTRSWCLFELLQTIQLEREDAQFRGLFFCTSTGVLNEGQATVELSMNIGKRLVGLRLENADATSRRDKDMINALVIQQMGSFHAINVELREHIKGALAVCKQRVDSEFVGLFEEFASQNHDAAGETTLAATPPASDYGCTVVDLPGTIPPSAEFLSIVTAAETSGQPRQAWGCGRRDEEKSPLAP